MLKENELNYKLFSPKIYDEDRIILLSTAYKYGLDYKKALDPTLTSEQVYDLIGREELYSAVWEGDGLKGNSYQSRYNMEQVQEAKDYLIKHNYNLNVIDKVSNGDYDPQQMHCICELDKLGYNYKDFLEPFISAESLLLLIDHS